MSNGKDRYTEWDSKNVHKVPFEQLPAEAQRQWNDPNFDPSPPETKATQHFFTFGSDSAYRNCYVEIEVPELTGNEAPYTATAGVIARTAMAESHGTKWSMQYDNPVAFAKQIEAYGLKRLSLFNLTEQGRWIAVDVMGEEG